MKIAVVGSGISGLTAAWSLAPDHDVTLFESASRLGGHTATIDVEEEGRVLPIDTGFIVFNDWTYPEFINILDTLDVASKPTEMSFSVSDARTGLEYAGSNLNTLFAQRRNLFSPRYLGMLRDILRFNSQVEKDLERMTQSSGMTLGQYLESFGYGTAFRDQYLIPMGAAIWSAREEYMLNVPLRFFVRFFRNHGLLNVRNRPQWRVIKGGSRTYIEPMIRALRGRIRLDCAVTGVYRREGLYTGTEVMTAAGAENFDQVVFACHSDQALRILGEQATPLEKKLLAAVPYEKNRVVLHTDTTLLPRNRRCWSSWNVALDDFPDARPRLTYNMNILQRFESSRTYCVSLNQTDRIHEDCIIGEYEYDHPIFDQQGMETQQRWAEINGIDGLWYCGAWWRNGFHEDGVWSALRVCSGITDMQALTGVTVNAA